MNFSIRPERQDFEALKISEEQFLEDLILLDTLGYDYDRNVVQFLHDTAKIVKLMQSED